MSRTDAVEALYQDMAARHRARFGSIHVSSVLFFLEFGRGLPLTDVQILKVVEIDNPDSIRRPYIKQLLQKNLKFPLPHRAAKQPGKKIFAYRRPSTFA